MEPLDPAKNEEDGRFSKRRISSILKAPRRSVRFPEPPEQENVVECAKPVEKRISRRVSFAPANDVLLFSKDVKNGSPVRSPLQELMPSTSAATQNGVQMVVTEDGIQPIIGMETLLNAPLHASQQRNMANFDTRHDLGEKTVVFSTDDAFLDMTQSHTINIDAGLVADISFQHSDSLPARGQKRVMLTAGDGTMNLTPRHNVNIGFVSNIDAGAQKRNISSAPILDPGFENFLASFSKPSAPSLNPVIAPTTPAASSDRASCSMAQVKTHKADVDKENQAPSCVSFAMEKTQSTSRKSGVLSLRSALCPDDDLSREMNEAQAGGILGFTEDDDVFQCLFPTQEMYSQLDNRASQTKEETHQQQIIQPQASYNPKEMTSLRNPSVHDFSQRHRIQFDAEVECREKPVGFTADDACVDVTKSPAHISTDFHLQSEPQVDFPPACGEKTVRFSASDEAAMDVTRCLTVHIATDFEPQSDQNAGFLPSGREQTIRFSSTDAAMDMTQCLTVHLDHISASDSLPQRDSDILPTHENMNNPLTAEKAQLQRGNRSMTTNAVDPGFIKSFSKTSGPMDDPVVARAMAPAALSPIKPVDTRGFLHQVQTQRPDVETVKEAPSLVSAAVENSVNKTTMDDDVSMEMTSAQTGCIVGETDEPPELSSEVLGASKHDGEEITNPHESLQSNVSGAACEQRPQTASLLHKTGNSRSAVNVDVGSPPPQRSRRMSLADLQSKIQFDAEVECREKPVGFTADDACVDVTRSPAHISTDFHLQSEPQVDFPPACGEKTVRFSASDDAAMDVTRCHTVHIATDFEPQSDQNAGFLPAGREQTIRFSSTDAAMDMTQCLTVHFDHISASDSLPQRDSDILPTHENMNNPLTAEKAQLQRGNRSMTTNAVDPGFIKSFSKTSGPMDNPVVTKSMAPAALSPIKTVDTRGFLHQVQTQRPDVKTVKEAPSSVSAAVDNSVNKTMMDNDVSMEMTSAQTGCIVGETDEPPELSSEVLGASNPYGKEITNPHESLQSNVSGAACEQRPQTASLLHKTGNSRSAVNVDVGSPPPQRSRRMSLADLQSKVRRLSHIIHTAPVDAYTAPVPRLEHDKKTEDDTKHPSVEEPQLEMGSVNAENTQAPTLTQGEQPFISTTPFNLKTKQLMSRLSVGSFKAKLPQRGKPEDPKAQITVGEPMVTLAVNVTDKLSNYDHDWSNIYDEELVTNGDMSETLDMSLQGATKEGSASHGSLMDELLGDDVFELDFSGSVPGKKRPWPVDETNEEDKKRTKTSTEDTADADTSPVEECDGYIANAPSMTGQSTDYSISSTRCEATFESTLKQSMFESQLEDYTNDVQRKLNDGTITVLEFFKLFNIDFIINNPRHSNFPGRALSDTDRTLMDLLKDRHIFRPQQLVYEADVLSLTEKVEGLKERMWDLEKPLKMVNRPLWEEMRNSSEEEFKSFGAKLKERNNFFRRMSKVQSHEMKEVLYSKLVQANREELQKSRETLEEADEMLKSLDVCIQELETELIAIEENGFEDKPSLKSLQEEMQKVDESLADNDRQISELELQKAQNSKELKRLKVETRKLESHVGVLHMVNEWKLVEKTENGTTYTFLHETLHLELLYEQSSGNDASNQSERKISHITFKLQLDDEKSQGHARLVHKLLSEFIEGEGDWAEKYPTSRHVPKLLQDVGLVVSRCRLLGEELRLLQLWGGLRLDILHISCLDTRVHIVFSRLKTFSKFEVIFSVSLVNHSCVLQVQSFKNVIGNATIQQVEEIVSSFSPAKNLLTKIVKRIHQDLLC
ncbi:knl1 [Pungitius sinensis]